MKKEIRKIEINSKERVETGAVQFNDDWPGLFIRGDNACYLALQITELLNALDDNRPFDPLIKLQLKLLAEVILKDVKV